MALNPMHQFEVYKIGPEITLGNINLSFTNASLFMALSSITIILLLFIGTKKKSLIPSKMQVVTEMSYMFVAKMINDTAGPICQHDGWTHNVKSVRRFRNKFGTSRR